MVDFFVSNYFDHDYKFSPVWNYENFETKRSRMNFPHFIFFTKSADEFYEGYMEMDASYFDSDDHMLTCDPTVINEMVEPNVTTEKNHLKHKNLKNGIEWVTPFSIFNFSC